MEQITPFLMFEGRAEEAMNFYISLFKSAEITSISRYGKNESGAEGTVQLATFKLNGQEFMCIDSSVKHGFTFTPAMSLHIRFDNEEEIERVFDALVNGGQILMPLGIYPFSKKYAWLSDKFGVSWQLNLSN